MPVTVIVGGQFGSEGKGKVAHALAQEKRARLAVRVGGPNSGHTVIDPRGNTLVLRQLPTAAILPEVVCVLGAGSYIDVDILLKEMQETGLRSDCLRIDPNAAVITEREKQEEASTALKQAIGSTLSGTGAAVGRRIARVRALRLAKDERRLQPFIAQVPQLLHQHLDAGERLILEGTQGFGLSVLHAPDYPYVTSRDTTAAAFVSEPD
jgi:adenylosuccinate synthase